MTSLVLIVSKSYYKSLQLPSSCFGLHRPSLRLPPWDGALHPNEEEQRPVKGQVLNRYNNRVITSSQHLITATLMKSTLLKKEEHVPYSAYLNYNQFWSSPKWAAPNGPHQKSRPQSISPRRNVISS
jgi:hypothetical protein